MIKFYFVLCLFLGSFYLHAQSSPSQYLLTFDHAVHHEAQVVATFTDLKQSPALFRMSRSSPGRYALHEFAKNVYNVEVTDGKGNPLKYTRPDLHSWSVEGHDGTIKVSYTLFGNHGDGTYAQIDETHAHLNMPATLIYVPELEDQGHEITFRVREDLNWKVATQLKQLEAQTYYAPHFQYLMDSPVELSNYRVRSFELDQQKISLILHDDAATESQIDDYFQKVEKIVREQKEMWGALPKFDYGEYLFLACYMPNATGDGMEHRNSTSIPSSRSLAQGGDKTNIGTVAHEFFHIWNVERLRPKSLEPFDFTKANMSGDLWFAEGFTSYFDDLSMVRAGLITHEDYLAGLTNTFNYVWTSPGRQYYNPIEMSYQAPFVDAARSVDETNRENTFISYYSYGSMLGLALDLSLREKGLNLDGFMAKLWEKYGKTEVPYTVRDLQETLIAYAGGELANQFFEDYIFKSGMPPYQRLLAQMGIGLEEVRAVDLGAFVRDQRIMNNPRQGSSAYKAGLQKEDKLLKIGDMDLDAKMSIASLLAGKSVGQSLPVVFLRHGQEHTLNMELFYGTSYRFKMMEGLSKANAKKTAQKLENWLGSKVQP